MGSDADRPGYLRVLAEFPVAWSRLHDDGTLGHRFTSVTANVSHEGIGMVTSEPVWEGERLRVEVTWGRPAFTVRSDATVLRVAHPGPNRWACALRFDSLEARVERQITQWLFAEERRAADRRASVRIPLQVIVTCRPLDADGRPIGDQVFKAATVDVAADGLRIETERELEEGQMLHVQFALGNPPQPTAAAGRIVWVRPTQAGWRAYGVHFEGLDDRTHRMITERAYAHERGQRRPAGGGGP